jgi:phytoene/squalene synthetase
VGPPDEHGKLISGSREEEGEHAMAGLALAIQLLEKKSSQVSTNSLHSFSTLTALSAAAAASSAISYLPDRPSLTFLPASRYYYVVCMYVLAAFKFCNRQM